MYEEKRRDPGKRILWNTQEISGWSGNDDVIFMLILEGLKPILHVAYSNKLTAVNYFLLVSNYFDNLQIMNEMSLDFLW